MQFDLKAIVLQNCAPFNIATLQSKTAEGVFPSGSVGKGSSAVTAVAVYCCDMDPIPGPELLYAVGATEKKKKKERKKESKEKKKR